VTTVSIVEDDAAFQAALSAMLRTSSQHRVLDICASTEEARRLVSARPPDIALVDIQLPGASGIALVAELAPRLRETAFVMITALDTDAAIFDALKAGAVGYLLKDFDGLSLLAAIDDAARGGSPMSWTIARRVVQSLRRPAPAPAPEVQTLSPREREVLEALARGLPYKQIADQLRLSEHTIRIHIRGIYRKLHVNCRTEAVVKFLGR
jgi:DNA-binding NarL/FixJ family response regulator